MKLGLKQILDLTSNNPKIFRLVIWRLYPKQKDKHGEFYSTRTGAICLN